MNTQNKAIKALNQFLSFYAVNQGKVIAKCPHYPRKMLAQVTASDLVDEVEIIKLTEALQDIRPISADLFVVLVRTGLRINEALGLSMKFITPGKIDGPVSEKIHIQLGKYSLQNYFGYICLESQPMFEPARVREKKIDTLTGNVHLVGSVPRKPLKSRPRIDPKWYRYIPVFDKSAWLVLAQRYNEQVELFEAKKHGPDSNDYLLFDGITASMFYQDLMKAFDKTRLRFRSPHKLRHTFLTWFYGQTNDDRVLAKKVGGHEDERTMEVYAHLLEQIGRERASQLKSPKRIDLTSP